MSTVPASPPSPDDTPPDVLATPYGQKDASHAAFYAGFAKGIFSAFDGMVLFASSNTLRAVFWHVLKPLLNAQLAYAAVGILLVFLLRDPADDISELFWTLSRWARVVTVIITFVLEKRFNTNSIMFFAALKELDPAFGAALEARPKTKTSFRDKWYRFKRVAKLTLFKITGAIINKVLPGGRYIAVPAVKFVSMRPVLGAPVAIGLSAIHVLPAQYLESSRVDDVLVSLGESVLDADDLGSDLTRSFASRLDSEDTRAYFADRYRGYLTGCGFVYSMLSAVPFLGIPMTLIAECGAACVVFDVVKRNLEKTNRTPLVCEDVLKKAS